MKFRILLNIFICFMLIPQLKAQSHEISVGFMSGKYHEYSTDERSWTGNITKVIGDSLQVLFPKAFSSSTVKTFYYNVGYDFGYRNIVKINENHYLRLSGNLNIVFNRYREANPVSIKSIGNPDTIAYEPPPPPPENPCEDYIIAYNPDTFNGEFRSFHQIRIGIGSEWVVKPFTKRLTIGAGPYLFTNIFGEGLHHYRHSTLEELNGVNTCVNRVITDETKGRNLFSPIHLEARASVQFDVFADFHIQFEWQQQLNNMFKQVISVAPTFYENFRPQRFALKLVYRVDKEDKEETAEKMY